MSVGSFGLVGANAGCESRCCSWLCVSTILFVNLKAAKTTGPVVVPVSVLGSALASTTLCMAADGCRESLLSPTG